MVSRHGPAPRPDTTRAKPYSLRLSDAGIRALSEEAARTRLAPRTLAQELIEEGLRMRRFPAIAFSVRGGRRAAVFARAPRLRVGSAIETIEASSSLEEAAEDLYLSVSELEQALDYYRSYRGEIDAENAGHREAAEAAYREWLDRSSRTVSRASAPAPR
ncbi:MAG TPA: hypothetical protein VFM93_06830 [Candidatus Limnocylindria bacterium]|nr:hypothetical protein [Candidatus Limnocylindria bacterium]